MSTPDLSALASALAVIGFGIVLLLDQLGELSLSFATASPVALATIGVVLVAAGLAKRDLDG